MPRIPTVSDAAAPADEEALIRAHLAAIGWIETHLFEPMTVKSIAERAGYSPSRFARGFTRLQGESVMSYVWGRRLEAALRRLLTEPRIRIVDLAFDIGFDSQEAFTRAFGKAFGHPPGRLRSLGPVRHMTRSKKASRLDPEIHERVEQVPELHFAGIVRRVTPANSHQMIDLWREVESFRDSADAIDTNTYLVVLGRDARSGGLDIMPSLRIPADVALPPTLRRHCVPASLCSVFRHVVRKGDVFPQVQAGRETLFARLRKRAAPGESVRLAFEVYPRGLAVRPGSWIDHYFAVPGSADQ